VLEDRDADLNVGTFHKHALKFLLIRTWLIYIHIIYIHTTIYLQNYTV